MRALLVLAVLAAAWPVQALELPAKADAVLKQGRAWVDVQPGPDGASGQILAAVDVPAPIEVVWSVITDCALAPKMAPNLKSCRIVESDPAGRWEVREQVSKGGLLPSVTSVFRSDFEKPRRIRFHRVGGDLQVLEGEWRLDPQTDGQTRVTYENRVAAPFHVPGAIARLVLRADVPTALNAMKRESMARAKK